MLDDFDVALIEQCFLDGMTDNQIRDAYGFSLEEISFAEVMIDKMERVDYD